jgi:hypothetical protein
MSSESSSAGSSLISSGQAVPHEHGEDVAEAFGVLKEPTHRKNPSKLVLSHASCHTASI